VDFMPFSIVQHRLTKTKIMVLPMESYMGARCDTRTVFGQSCHPDTGEWTERFYYTAELEAIFPSGPVGT